MGMLTFDHLAYAAGNLATGAQAVSAALGVDLPAGGVHAAMGTHNRLTGLGDLYLEVIAVDPAAPPPPRPRWFDLDRFAGPTRLTNWIARCDDLEAAIAAAPLGMGAPMRFERGPYVWRMAVPDDGILPFGGGFPALIQWEGAAHPAANLPDSGLRLIRLQIVTPEADALRAALARVISDGRIRVEPGETFAMHAGYAGPGGEVWL